MWLVENTSLTFDQVAEFCKLHPLEVKGIADGEVAAGIKGHDPISSGQLMREEIQLGEKNKDHHLRLAPPKGAVTPAQEDARAPLHAAVASAGPSQCDPVAGAQPSGAQGRADHAARRDHEDDPASHSRPDALELVVPRALGSGDAGPLLADRPRFRGQPRRQGPSAVVDDRGQTLVSAEVSTARPRHSPSTEAEVFGSTSKPRREDDEDDIDVASVFSKQRDDKQEDEED